MSSSYHPPPAELREKFRAIVDAITSGDLGAFDPLVRLDMVDHNPVPAQGDGRPGLKFWARELHEAIPDLTASIEDTVVENDKLAARVFFRGTHRGDFLNIAASGEYVEFETFFILRFVDGLVVEWWDASNTGRALRSLGAPLSFP
ncbi:SnoaL-like polyketide cyclase [Rhodococcus sp. SMB37]|uniref:ester cyclase n=1 Tax=Rhodococcus sp. SMB37 TaxID=2512213 RepID=UPI0010D9B0F0|nr:ester cyclase [Rhodococcus sp. SMB37]TCN42469.1 SnoaL-like polyketide cyclase [Rhodococcus sp. SMB37]